MSFILENWAYKPNKYEYSEYDGRADLTNLQHEAWISFETNDNEKTTRNRIDVILQWIYENELILKSYAADNGAYENWGAEYTVLS